MTVLAAVLAVVSVASAVTFAYCFGWLRGLNAARDSRGLPPLRWPWPWRDRP